MDDTYSSYIKPSYTFINSGGKETQTGSGKSRQGILQNKTGSTKDENQNHDDRSIFVNINRFNYC